MKIGFITYKKEAVDSAFDVDYDYSCFYTKIAGNKLAREGFLPPSETAFHLAQTLEKNKDFLQFINEANQKIPVVREDNNYTFMDNLCPILSQADPESYAFELWKVLEQNGLGRDTLCEKYDIHSDLLEHIPFLVTGHMLMLPFCRPDFEIELQKGNGLYSHIEKNSHTTSLLSIKLAHRKTINAIIKFLNENKKELNYYLNKLDKNPWYISTKAMKAYDLRCKGKKYSDIADELSSQFFQEDDTAQTNEDSVKKLATRTKRTIYNLFKKKTT